ncbi:N-acetyltransferase [Salinicola endophyticus]|uniref:N-acetyltransferase n=3 Tax=Salinicola endophyticus TaxID=1949083 RepID=A0ABY8FMZ4_9GAMM|nr:MULTISPECIES: N-acetyltransferase [Salinicola]WFF42086.1 N-acetyltransferase [Salinicola endophyticus]
MTPPIASIRAATPRDLPAMTQIWLEASCTAHDFVPASFWRNQRQAMQEVYLPAAENHVYVVAEAVVGFLSLCDSTLAALFVAPSQQGRGVGGALLAHAQTRRDALELQVYQQNEGAVRFYQTHGFIIVASGVDAHTGAPEWHMRYG